MKNNTSLTYKYPALAKHLRTQDEIRRKNRTAGTIPQRIVVQAKEIRDTILKNAGILSPGYKYASGYPEIKIGVRHVDQDRVNRMNPESTRTYASAWDKKLLQKPDLRLPSTSSRAGRIGVQAAKKPSKIGEFAKRIERELSRNPHSIHFSSDLNTPDLREEIDALIIEISKRLGKAHNAYGTFSQEKQ